MTSHSVRPDGSRLGTVLSASVAAVCLAFGPAQGRAAALQMPVPPPPMGWSSWNSFGGGISQAIIDGQADALMQFDAQLTPGTPIYNRLNIDDGYWPASAGRDGNGVPILDPNLWPGGTLAGAVAHIHSDGLLAGAYTDIGHTGCAGGGGSEGYYVPDMLRFAQDGFDYVKVDFCGGQAEGLDPAQSYAEFTQAVQQAELASGRSIYLSVCDWGFYGPNGFPDAGQGPWTWAPGVGFVNADIWRTSEDITFDVGPQGSASFEDVLLNFHSSIHPESQHTGYHNDPDMMVVGLNGVDVNPAQPVQSQAHMSLWAVAGAPLLIGANMNTVLQQPAIEAVLSNPQVIAVDQDPRGLSAIEVAAPGPGLEVWARLLSGHGRRAVVFLNTSSATASLSVSAAQLGLIHVLPMAGTDLWTSARHAYPNGRITVSVPAQAATMLLVTGTDLLPVESPAVASTSAVETATLQPGVGYPAAQISQGPTPLDIVYRNPTKQTVYDLMTVNGGPATVVAFPPTAAKTFASVSVTPDLSLGTPNTVALQSASGVTQATIRSVSVVAGPVPAFQPVYQADAPGNALTGAAVVQPCSSCSDGHNVGFVGTGWGATGTLTVNNVTVAAAGTYTILVAYLNGDQVDRQATLTVNGQTGGTFNFPRAKDWNTVQVAPITAQLQPGPNSIAFANSTNFAPNFSALGAPR